MERLLLGVLLAAVSSYSMAAPTRLEECNEAASTINKSTPLSMDKYTTLVGAMCVQEGKTVVLIYTAKLSFPKDQLARNAVSTQTKNSRTYICTTPKTRAMLDLVDVRYHYLDSTNAHVAYITTTKKDCKNI